MNEHLSQAPFDPVQLNRYSDIGLERTLGIRTVRSGWVSHVAGPLHPGRGLRFWDIDIRDQDGNLNCSARLTVRIAATDD